MNLNNTKNQHCYRVVEYNIDSLNRNLIEYPESNNYCVNIENIQRHVRYAEIVQCSIPQNCNILTCSKNINGTTTIGNDKFFFSEGIEINNQNDCVKIDGNNIYLPWTLLPILNISILKKYAKECNFTIVVNLDKNIENFKFPCHSFKKGDILTIFQFQPQTNNNNSVCLFNIFNGEYIVESVSNKLEFILKKVRNIQDSILLNEKNMNELQENCLYTSQCKSFLFSNYLGSPKEVINLVTRSMSPTLQKTFSILYNHQNSNYEIQKSGTANKQTVDYLISNEIIFSNYLSNIFPEPIKTECFSDCQDECLETKLININQVSEIKNYSVPQGIAFRWNSAINLISICKENKNNCFKLLFCGTKWIDVVISEDVYNPFNLASEIENRMNSTTSGTVDFNVAIEHNVPITKIFQVKFHPIERKFIFSLTTCNKHYGQFFGLDFTCCPMLALILGFKPIFYIGCPIFESELIPQIVSGFNVNKTNDFYFPQSSYKVTWSHNEEQFIVQKSSTYGNKIMTITCCDNCNTIITFCSNHNLQENQLTTLLHKGWFPIDLDNTQEYISAEHFVNLNCNSCENFAKYYYRVCKVIDSKTIVIEAKLFKNNFKKVTCKNFDVYLVGIPRPFSLYLSQNNFGNFASIIGFNPINYFGNCKYSSSQFVCINNNNKIPYLLLSIENIDRIPTFYNDFKNKNETPQTINAKLILDKNSLNNTFTLETWDKTCLDNQFRGTVKNFTKICVKLFTPSGLLYDTNKLNHSFVIRFYVEDYPLTSFANNIENKIN